jgi:hypothetical protein
MLPKIAHARFKTKLISSDKVIEMRPFLVKEEKILLTALEGNDDKEIVYAITSILQSCMVTEGVRVTDLPSFDIEYLFLQLRKRSVGETVQLKMRHKDDSKCLHAQPVVIDLDQIKIHKEDVKKTIQLNAEIGVEMKYPTPDSIDGLEIKSISSLFTLIGNCIVSVFTADEVFSEFTQKEMSDWLENLNEEQISKIVKFLETTPYIYYDLKYTCQKCGKAEEYQLKGLKDFFI